MPDYSLLYRILASNQTTQAFNEANQALGGLARRARRVGQTMTLGLTTPIIGMGTAAVKAASDLDREMRNIQSISKQTNTEIDALAGSFVDMSTDITRTTDDAEGLASAFYQIQGSGFAGADAMEVLEASTLAASAGLTRTEVAAEAVSARLNAYGLEAEEAERTSDLMFRTVDRGVGSFEELSNSLGFIVGTAAQAGVSFDEVSAALSTMSKQGIDFQMGARALNMVILALIDPSDEMANGLERIGFESGQTALDTLGLAGTLQTLAAAGYAGTEGMASLGLNARALRGALALTGEGAQVFADDLEAMGDASGAAREAFEIQVQSFESQVKNLRNTINSVLIPVGSQLIREVLMPMAEELVPVIQALGDVDPATLQWGIKLAGALAIAGPGILVIGKLATVYTALSTAFGGVAVAAAAKTTALGTQAVAETTAIANAGVMATKYAALLTIFQAIARWSPLVFVGLTAAGGQDRTLQSDLAAAEESIRAMSSSYATYRVNMQDTLETLEEFYRAQGIAVSEIELMDRGIALSREEWRDWRFSMQDAEAALVALQASFATTGDSVEFFTGGPLGDFREGIEDLANLQGIDPTNFIPVEELQERIAQVQELIAEGYENVISQSAGYAEQLAALEEGYTFDRQMVEIDQQMARQASGTQYHQQLLESEAAYQVEMLALQLQGKGEELGNLQTAHEEELAQLAYRFSTAEANAQFSYEKQVALAEVHQKRQLYLQAVAHEAQLKEDIAYFAEQSKTWLAQNKALFEGEQNKYDLLMMLLGIYHTESLTVEQAAADAHVRLEEIKAQATIEGSAVTLAAISEVIQGYQAALDAAAGNVSEARELVNEALGDLQNITLNLPPVPDFTQYMPDYGEVAKRAGRATRDATQAASAHVVDFEKLIEDAIAALDLLSGYEAPAAIRAGAEELKDALILIMPVLAELDSALDDTISREGMEKVRAFAQTVREVADSVESLYELAQFQRPDMLSEPFLQLQEVMVDLAWSFEVAQETWDRYLSKDQIAEIGSFADSVFKLAEAMGAFREMSTMTPLGPDWVDDFLEDFVVNLEALSRRLADIEQADYMEGLSLGFIEKLGAMGQAIQVAQGGLNAIVSRWQVGGMESRIDEFISDIDYVLTSLAGQEEEWSDLDYSGVLAYLTGVVGEIASLVGNLSTDFRSQMQPIGYELMMGIRDGIEEGGPVVLEYLLEALTDIAGVAGLGGLPEEGPGGEGLGMRGGPGGAFIMAPVFIESDEYRDSGGEWDLQRLGDDLMMVYERETR